MPYVKTNWQDRLVEDPNSFRVTDNGDGTSTIEEAPGEVFVQGTPVSAQNLNKMEQGIEEATRIAEEGTAVATQAEAEAGTNNAKKMTPLRVFQAIAKRITDLIATSTEAIAGATNIKLMSPLRTKELVDNFAITKRAAITLANTPNLNTLTTPGMYALVQPGPTKSQNYPPTEASYSFLLVANTVNAQTLQVSAGHDQQYFAYRVNYDGNWTTWRTIATTNLTGELANLTTNVKTSLVNAINELKSAQTIATQNEAEAGTDNTRIMTPLRVIQSVARRLRENSKLDLYNLYKKSYNFISFTNLPRWLEASNEDSYKGFPTRYTGDRYFGLSKLVELEVGTYTLLAYVKTDPNVIVQGYVSGVNGGKINGNDGHAISYGNLPNFTLLKFTFNVTTKGSFNPRFEKSNDVTGRTFISLLRLFEGDVERPWFEAIDDNTYNIATEAETLEGTEDSKIVTPLKLLQSKVAPTAVYDTNLNNVVKQGTYFVQGNVSQNITNKPSNLPNGSFYLYVQTAKTLRIPQQRLIHSDTSLEWTRTRTSDDGAPDVWTQWVQVVRQIATQTEAATATNNDKVMTPLRTDDLLKGKYGIGGYIPFINNNDYNAYLTTGFYRLPTGSVNAPNQQTNNVLVIARSESIVNQIAYQEHTNRSYRRSKTAENGWSAWKEDVDTTITGNLTQLQTTQKGNLVSAINEAFQFANDGKTRIAQVIGSPVVTGDTFTQMQTKIQTIKNKFRDNLVAKGVQAGNNESLDALVNKIPLITSGIRTLSGTANSLPGDYGFQHADGTQALSPLLQVTGLPFRPKKITVRAAQGSVLFESIYDLERGIYSNTATLAQYSNETSVNFTAKPISMNAQNGYVTDSGFSIPVALPSYPYSWYIEGDAGQNFNSGGNGNENIISI